MNRLDLLNEINEEICYNLHCYSEDALMTKPKSGYEEQWNKENEKLEIIQELIDEEKNSTFKVYTTMSSLKNKTDIRKHIDLAYIENRNKCISCYLTSDGIDENGKPNFMLVLSVHKKGAFDDEYENIYTRDIKQEAFANRETLKNEMQYALDIFEGFIEADKKSNRFYNKYYEDKEIEEFE